MLRSLCRKGAVGYATVGGNGSFRVVAEGLSLLAGGATEFDDRLIGFAQARGGLLQFGVGDDPQVTCPGIFGPRET